MERGAGLLQAVRQNLGFHRSPTVHSRCSHRLVHFHTRRSPCWEHLQQALRVWATVLRCARLSPVHPQSSKLLHRSTGTSTSPQVRLLCHGHSTGAGLPPQLNPRLPIVHVTHDPGGAAAHPVHTPVANSAAIHPAGLPPCEALHRKSTLSPSVFSPQPRLEHRLSATPRLRITDCPTGGWLLGIHWPGERPSGAQAVCSSSLL